MQQFSKLTNVYFLIVSILQGLKEISITGGKSAMASTLAFTVAMQMAKDGYEDFKRSQTDTKENNTPVKVYCYKEKKFMDRSWSDLRKGDIVLIEPREEDEASCKIPADMVLIASSNLKG